MSIRHESALRRDVRGPQITREAIIVAALHILDTEGVAALNIRRLGEQVKVSGPALYHHFRDKDEILFGITAHLRNTIKVVHPAGMDFAEWLVRTGLAYFSVFVAHPNAAPLLLIHTARSSVHTSAITEYVLAQFAEHGIPAERRMTILDALESYCLGAVLIAIRNDRPLDLDPFSQLAAAQRSNVCSPIAGFEHGYRALVGGIIRGTGNSDAVTGGISS